jgi:hypothetical protein
MGIDEQKEYAALSARIADRYSDADFRERAALAKELLAFDGSDRTRLIDAAWVKLDTMLIRYLFVFDSFSESSILKLEDETTGAYVSILFEAINPRDARAAIRELLEDDAGEDAAKKLVMEADRSGMDREIFLDVNGAALFMEKADAQNRDSLGNALSLLWKHLPEGAARERIELALPLIWKAADDDEIFGSLRLKWEIDQESTPHNECLIQGTEFTKGQKGGSLIDLEGPPDEILERFFSEPTLPLPDPDSSFRKLRKEIL